MDRVGGYLGYLALTENGRALEDVLIVMRAEAEARQILEARARAG